MHNLFNELKREVSCRCFVYVSESLVLTKTLHLQWRAFAQLILFNQN